MFSLPHFVAFFYYYSLLMLVSTEYSHFAMVVTNYEFITLRFELELRIILIIFRVFTYIHNTHTHRTIFRIKKIWVKRSKWLNAKRDLPGYRLRLHESIYFCIVNVFSAQFDINILLVDEKMDLAQWMCLCAAIYCFFCLLKIASVL